MRFLDFVLLLVFNCVIIYILYTIQKRSIAESLKNLKKEIGELEDLVAAIIEEFEEIADSVISKEDQTESKITYHNQLEIENIDNANDSFDTPSRDLQENDDSAQSLDNSLEVDNVGQLLGNTVEPDNTSKSFNDTLEQSEIRPLDKNILYKRSGVEQPVAFQAENVKEVQNPAANSEKSGRQIDGLNVKDPKHKQILELRSEGLTIEEIARKLEKGRGEIQLVLGLYKRS